MASQWGPWTRIKLDTLGKYLQGFARASTKAQHRLYLDLFAGTTRNQERKTGLEILGSASRALDASPAFDVVLLFELNTAKAADLDGELHRKYPDRDIRVVRGDCNRQVMPALATLHDDYRFAAAFAFLDQLSADISWETITALAQFKHERSKTKMEQWLYFGDSFIFRGLTGAVGNQINAAYAARVDRMFGTTVWRHILNARRSDEIEPAEARSELINLMRWRLESDLGYATTLPLQIPDDEGRPLYTMIFATDHSVGNKIMRSCFAVAREQVDRMKKVKKVREAESSAKATGAQSLFGDDDPVDLVQGIDDGSGLPEIPPWRPKWLD